MALTWLHLAQAWEILGQGQSQEKPGPCQSQWLEPWLRQEDIAGVQNVLEPINELPPMKTRSNQLADPELVSQFGRSVPKLCRICVDWTRMDSYMPTEKVFAGTKKPLLVA
ncbi:hypothetical protein DFH09DRAFT_1075257 [Mycena vulgaris]|nr:hypothetical protein DFH09DRAFT_1075257 [Mycena vulgaris]